MGQTPFCAAPAATPPYAILWASQGWLAVCGFTAPEIVGIDFKCIQGPATDRRALGVLMDGVRSRSGTTPRTGDLPSGLPAASCCGWHCCC